MTLILTYLCVLGTDAAMAFYFYDAKDRCERKLYITNALIFSAGLCILFSILSYVFSSHISALLYKSPEGYGFLLPVAFSATVGAIVIQHLLGYARYSKRILVFNLCSISYVAGTNLLSVFLLIYLNIGLVGFFYGQLIGQALIANILLFIFRHELVFKISKSHVLSLLRYGIPLLPSLLSFLVLSTGSKLIIYYIGSGVDAAIYEVVLRLASMINLLTAPFFLAWRPFSMSIKDNEDSPKIYGLVGKGFLAISSLSILLIQCFVFYFVQFYVQKPSLLSSYLYVWILSFGVVLNVLHMILGVGLLIKKKNTLISKGFIIAAIINLIGSFLLVPHFKIWGAAGMTLVSYLFVIVWILIKNQKVFPIDINIRNILIYLAIFLLVMVTISVTQANNYDFAWLVYIASFLITVTAQFATKLISIDLLKELRRVISGLIKRLGKVRN